MQSQLRACASVLGRAAGATGRALTGSCALSPVPWREGVVVWLRGGMSK